MIQIVPFDPRHAEPESRTPDVPAVVQRFASALAADAPRAEPAAPAAERIEVAFTRRDPLDAPLTADERHAAAGFFALALAITGVFIFALPLGMLSAYLGGRALAGLVRAPRWHALALAVAALGAVGGAADAGIALWRLSGGLSDVLKQMGL